MDAARMPRAVVVTRASDYEALVAVHGTREQARFFLETRGIDIAPLEESHALLAEALRVVLAAIPPEWRRARVDRTDLDRFLFDPHDVVVSVGQDGLVANVAKYLDGQPVVGVNPDPSRSGLLAVVPPKSAGEVVRLAAAGKADVEARTMVEARLDDGQSILSLNEVFVGHATHQSARYTISVDGSVERQSSSGLIVATGTGATGWAASIARERRNAPALPAPGDPELAWFVREAWPSPATGTGLTVGILGPEARVEVVSEMQSDGVVFGDGIESDSLAFGWGRRVTLRRAGQHLALVTV